MLLPQLLFLGGNITVVSPNVFSAKELQTLVCHVQTCQNTKAVSVSLRDAGFL